MIHVLNKWVQFSTLKNIYRVLAAKYFPLSAIMLLIQTEIMATTQRI
jgi:hypothetical protein